MYNKVLFLKAVAEQDVEGFDFGIGVVSLEAKSDTTQRVDPIA
jgi:hypothetical protein